MELSRCSSSSLWRHRTSETSGSDSQRPRQLKSNGTGHESKLDILQHSSTSYILDPFRSFESNSIAREGHHDTRHRGGGLQDPAQRDWTATKPGIRDTREEGREGSWTRNARARTTHCIAMSHLHSDMAGRRGKEEAFDLSWLSRDTVDDLSST